MLLIGLCYAETTPMLPLAGGEVAYAYGAFGTAKAFVVGSCLAFGYISISGFEAISVGRVLGFMIPSLDSGVLYEFAGSPVYATHLAIAIGCTALITWLHYRGVELAAAFQRWLIVAFAIVCAVFVVAGFVVGNGDNIGSLFPENAGSGGIAGGILVVLVTVPFWFVGFDTVPQTAEEAHVSVKPRQLAKIIVASIVAATVFYVLIVASVAMVVPREVLEGASLPAAHAFEAAFGSPLIARLVLIAAVLGLLTSWNGFFLAGSRVVFALGRGRIISGRLGETHPVHGTPHRAILLTGALTLLAPLLGRDALLAIVNAGSFFIAVAFLGVALSVIHLRRTRPDLARPFRLPGGPAIPIAAAFGSAGILAAMVIPGSPAALSWPTEILILAAFAACGLAFWVGARGVRSQTSEKERAFLIMERFAPPVSKTNERAI
jgi:amino acid transporter